MKSTYNIDEREIKLGGCNKVRELLKKFPKQELVVYSTPLHRLKNLEKTTGHNSLWIKRDDMTGLGIGGNKIRNLEYLLGDAVENQCDTILVSGPLQSNLCPLAAAAARKLGLDCISVHNDDPPKALEGNTLLNYILGIQSIYIGKVDTDERTRRVEQISKDIIKKGKKPYIIYNGTSTPLGAMGYVEAAVELHEQCLKKHINIKHVFVPGGNGGLAAGFIFGTGLLDIPFHVHVISVENHKNELYKIIVNFKNKLEGLIGEKLSYNIDDIMTVYENYRGEGWGCSTKESDEMIFQLARLEGIFVEKVYTSKTVVGMVDMVKNNIILKNEGICYIHTGGLGSLFAQF